MLKIEVKVRSHTAYISCERALSR